MKNSFLSKIIKIDNSFVTPHENQKKVPKPPAQESRYKDVDNSPRSWGWDT